MSRPEPAPFAPVVIELLQGVLYHDDTKHWDLLLRYEASVRDYVGKIGLALHLDETDGYAYLRQPEQENEDDVSLPRLTHRHPLSFNLTLLGVLLRERLQTFETSGSASRELVLSKDDIYEMMRLFLEEHTDESRLLRKIDRYIRQAEDVGFLKERGGTDEKRYEVRRVLKAKFSADTLAALKAKLEAQAGS